MFVSPRPVTTLALLAFVTGCPNPAADGESPRKAPKTPIRIGAVLPLTGSAATYGVAVRNGLELAVAEANEASAGAQIELLYEDDRGEPDRARQMTETLVTSGRAAALIGEATSSGAFAVAAVAQRAQVAMVAPAATLPAVTAVGDQIFRACFTDPLQAEVMARFAIETLAPKKVAVVRDVNSEYSAGLTSAFAAAMKAAAIQVAPDEIYDRADSNLDGLVNRLMASGADVIYIPGYAREIGRLAAALKTAGSKARLLGADGWDSAELRLRHGGEIEGAHYTTHWNADEPRPEVTRFVNAFEARFNERPDAAAALGYDSAKLLIAAIHAAGSPDRSAVRVALAKTSKFAGVTGRIDFSAGRDPAKGAVVVRVEGGKPVFVSRIRP